MSSTNPSKRLPCFGSPAVGEVEAAEEALSGGPAEGARSPESGEVLVASSPQGRGSRPAGRPQVPRCKAPAEGSARHCESSGTTVRGGFGTNYFYFFILMVSQMYIFYWPKLKIASKQVLYYVKHEKMV